MRVIALLAAAGLLAFGQFESPRLGFVRAADGSVRSLRGVAGNFILGEKVVDTAEALWCDGEQAFARTAEGIVTLNGSGEITGSAEEMPRADDLAIIEGDELVITATGVRLRLPFEIGRIERAGREYLHLSGESGHLLARIAEGNEEIYILPEAAE